MKPEPAVELLILTEDGSQEAQERLEPLVKRALELAEPGRHWVTFVPPKEHREQRLVVQANRWKDKRRSTELVRFLAEQLIRGRFVIFHFDGDRPWSQRESSENAVKFEELIRSRVRKLAEEARRDAADADARLRALVPYYSVEAWLMQNTAALRALGVTVPPEWEEDGALDALQKPKEHLPFGDKHNTRLAAEGWPAEQAHARSPSLRAAVAHLQDSAPLIAALKPERFS